MKKILYIILASLLLVPACDTTSTSSLLDGDFLPADTSPPSNQYPDNGQVIIDLNNDEDDPQFNDVLDMRLSWTAK